MQKKGRPPKRNADGTLKYDIPQMCEIIDKYTEDHKNAITPPIAKECCLDNGWNYDYVMQLCEKHPELSISIKKLIQAKEIWLEKRGLLGEVSTGFAIFTLKAQCGWRDNAPVNDIEETMKQLKEMFSNVKSNI